MKKYFLFFLGIILFTTSCEKDDFCIDPITPNLVVRFYDVTNPTEILPVGDLTIWPEGRDSIVVNQTLDSIALPLDVTNPRTVYNFQMGSVIDQITIDYTINEVFVSRSCGYKAVFTSVLGFPTTNWISYIEQTTTIIEDESAAHINIFH